MESKSPQASDTPRSRQAVSELSEPREEVTGVRRVVYSTFKNESYPPNPERTMKLDKNSARNLATTVEIQVDSWGNQRMLKACFTVKRDLEKTNTTRETLEGCKTKKKIYGFEEHNEDDTSVFTIYYKYT